MNRIVERFAALRARGEKALVIYLGAGDPDLEATRQLALALDQAGVDVLELGVPFSDPLADGLVNQLAAQRGLASGTTPKKVLETVAAIRAASQIPIVLYIYFNLLHRVGVGAFVEAAAAAGVDGLLALDLPPEEAGEYSAAMQASGLCPIYLVAPTTPEARVAQIAPWARGFVYYVSREGVTGMRDSLDASIGARVEAIRRHTDLPVAVGFGISNPEQARAAAALADGVVVGSAVVSRIATLGRSPGMPAEVCAFVRLLADAIHS